ncbi:hypothetical protein FJ208_02040, partial [Candidatus Gribaldobacteria bacterium]|nr:hypothetical protein [Candidatus Gribaldobacteria bacterium]
MLKRTYKFLLSFPEQKRQEITALMAKEACFEIEKLAEPAKEIKDVLQENEYFLSSLDFIIDFLTSFAKKQTLFNKLKQGKVVLSANRAKGLFNKAKIKKEINEITESEKQISLCQTQAKELAGKIKALEWFAQLESKPADTKQTFSLVALTDLNNLEKIHCFAKENNIFLKSLLQQQNKISLFFLGLKEKKESALNFLAENKINLLPYNFDLGPKAEMRKLKLDLQESEAKIQALERDLQNKAIFLNDYKILRDIFNIELSKAKASEACLAGSFFSHLVFWAKEEDKEALSKQLANFSADISLTALKLEENETPPVVLENKKSIRPFEYVTEIFGLPKQNEIDPTPYLAFFFILFFGICITDAAYGLIMALGLGILMLVKKETAQNKLIKLLFYGGISTFLVGMLFGSYF